MATEKFVDGKVEELVKRFSLSIKSSDEEIKKAIRMASCENGVSEYTREVCPGVTVTYRREKAIFPKYVYTPDGNGGWDVDHEFGQGDNEDFDYILHSVERRIVVNADLPGYITLSLAREYSASFLRGLCEELKRTESCRGGNSPYCQNYNLELELAIMFGIEQLLQWYDSMHWKAYADFLCNLDKVASKFGKEEVCRVAKLCTKDFDYFISFATEAKGELIEILSFWKWLRRIHAITGIENEAAIELDRFYGRAKIDKILKEKEEEISSLPREMRRFVVSSVLAHDSSEWVKSIEKEEQGVMVERMARQMGIKMSLACKHFKAIEEMLTLSEMRDMTKKTWSGCTNKIISFWELLVFVQKNSEALSVFPKGDMRSRAVNSLFANPERNTRWWPMVANEYELRMGFLAEKQGKEGIEGVQRTRWLIEHLGEKCRWIGKVDEIMSWEDSCDVIRKNPWIKSAKDFINKEDVIINLAKGGDLSFLKFTESRTEYQALEKAEEGSVFQEVIYSSWSADIQGWFSTLAKAVGEELAWDYIGNRNRHDQLFFVENMLEKMPVVQLKHILLQVRHNFTQFSQAVNAYVSTDEGQKIQSYKEFVKCVELQKNQIVFSSDAPQVLKEKILEMLEAPGVNVASVKNFYADKSNWPLILGQEDEKAIFHSHKEEFFNEPLHMLVLKALGCRSNKTLPLAENPGLLFKKLSLLAKSAGMKVENLVKEVPQEIKNQVIELLREHKTPMGDVYTAEVLAKSDPRGWVIGDWTNCCMQFGTGKNDEYMRRRDMAYFIISLNGRPIAQSVVVAAQKSNDALSLENATLADFDAIALDNVEVSHNFTQHNAVINQCYRDFWSNYSRSHQVIIGLGHNDSTPSTKKVGNYWKPLRTMVYSDCFGHSQCYILSQPEKKIEERKNEIQRAA